MNIQSLLMTAKAFKILYMLSKKKITSQNNFTLDFNVRMAVPIDTERGLHSFKKLMYSFSLVSCN